jgi:hypothetical protein
MTMQAIKIEIEVKGIFKNIAEVSNNDVVIGYLTHSDDAEKPVSAVLPNGENFGDFDCYRCACTKLHMHASNIDPRSVVDLPDPLELMAMLLASVLSRRHAL